MAAKDVKLLMVRKNEIESEITALTDVLKSHGTNMNDELIDEDGYPKPNVDIITVRKTRVRIIYLQNDLKQLMKQIEDGIHHLHAESRQKMNEENQLSIVKIAHPDEKPFLRVDVVSSGSPAEKAGLKVDDLIIKFGSINVSNFVGLQTVGSIVQHSKGKEVLVNVKRNGELKTVTLVPDVWNGKGLLGCNVIPYSN